MTPFVLWARSLVWLWAVNGTGQRLAAEGKGLKKQQEATVEKQFMDRAVGRKRICPMFSGLLTLVSSIPSASSHGSNHGSPCLGAPFPGLGGDSCLCMGLLSCVYMLQNLFLPSPSLWLPTMFLTASRTSLMDYFSWQRGVLSLSK